MTEWTSISLKESQKREIEKAQEKAGHDGAIGKFIVQQISGEPISANESINTEELAKAVATEIEKTDREDFDDWFSPDVAQTIAQHVINDMEFEVDVDAIVDELKDELSMAADPTVQPDVESLVKKVENLEAAVKEATQAAQSAEQTVEGLR